MDDLTPLLQTFRGRRVLVTGSTGFKGSWLCTWLVGLQAEVTGYALPPAEDAPLFGLLRLKDRIRQHFGDVRDLGALQRCFDAAKPEIVIHLAAQSLVRRGYAEPKLTFDTNIGGSVNLLEAVRATFEVKALVFITSDKCYLNKEWDRAYREDDQLGGEDPYSSSKAAAELVFACYQSAYLKSRRDFGAASARAGNVIGGGDRALDRIVPDCIRALEAKAPIKLRHPQAIRPWQHVLEPVSGYLTLAARLFAGEEAPRGSWNFAPDPRNAHTVQDVAERIVHDWGHGQVVIAPEAGGQHEAQLLILSSDKAKAELGWYPRWGFSDAVGKTVEWYRQVGAGADPVGVTERQITEYLAHP